ncbi:MAG TPA: DUF3368 domain-containing protein [Flavipsychrobacter sp.]|nr:DUF3368 domain-containing protein [Flavipsychrobacter sp.]
MQQGYDIVIADTSCFILLNKIGELELLKSVFQTVCTTSIIAEEFGNPLPDWIIIEELADDHTFQVLKLETEEGEASAIALAIEKQNALLILDDHKARKLAARLQLLYTGTFGIILRAKQNGIISSVKPILDKIAATNFRFSQSIYHEILSAAGEK